MPPDLLEPFLCLNQLQISSAETNTLEKSVEIIQNSLGPFNHSPHSKFLTTPLRKNESDRCSLGIDQMPRASRCLNPALIAGI